MESVKENFEFLNSPMWLKHTHDSYRSLENIRHRLKQNGESEKDSESQISNVLKARKLGAIPLFLKSIDKKFWFFPADCIMRKIREIEVDGQQVYELIHRNSSFEKDFYLDATIEEAISSAIYEGANSTRAEAQQLIASGSPPKTKDEWMLVNNFRAMQWIKENKTKEVSKDLILNIHEIVTRNTLSGDDINFAGKFRNDRVFVHSRTNEVKHEGIDFKKIETAIDEAIEVTTKNPRYLPPLLKGILLHYFIAYIHPFFDGNGRTARTLFYFKAMKNSLPFVELLSVSAYLKNYGRQYEKSFEDVVSNQLDITYFIDFNLDALLKAVKKVREKVEFLVKIVNLKARYELSDFQIVLLQKTALHKFRKIDVESFAAEIGRSREIARQELKKLSDLGFMVEERESKKFVYTISLETLAKAVADYA